MPRNPTKDDERWCIEALREVLKGAELSRSSTYRLQRFGLLDGLGSPTPAGRRLLEVVDAQYSNDTPRWMTCQHPQGWKPFGKGLARCPDCNLVRSTDIPVVVRADRDDRYAELEARIAQLEAALTPFAEQAMLWTHLEPDERDVYVTLGRLRDAAQALGWLAPDAAPGSERSEVGLGR